MNRSLFLLGLHLLCMSVLVQQIALTRILSVMSYFHLAFVSISMAMLGLTAGSVWVYLRGVTPAQAGPLLSRVSFLYGLATVVALLFLVSTYLPTTPGLIALSALIKIIAMMAVPFSAAGVAIAIALTRGPGKIGLRYAIDLSGAALGCLLCIPLLDVLSGPSVVLFAGLIGFAAAGLFHLAQPLRAPLRLIHLLPVLTTLTIIYADSTTPFSFHLLNVKSREAAMVGTEYSKWNSFSEISVTPLMTMEPFFWDAGAGAPEAPQNQRFLLIDGMAGTPMYEFDGDYRKPDFLRYDITNLAYRIRHEGRAAIIGVGGGRDILAARHFGFQDVTAVELNPIIINLLTTTPPYKDFANLAQDPAIHLHVDDGRSWFARTTEKFDLLQMSMIDTFAATGAGGFTLSENGLYTMEGWARFFNALSPNGVLTVSRWYAPGALNETGRVLSLAMATLFNAGIENPRDHIYLAGSTRLATLILSRAPLTTVELDALDRSTTEMGFSVLVHPNRPLTDPVLAGIGNARSVEEIQSFASRQPLDVSAPSDNRPFFFNQLKLLHLFDPNAHETQEPEGVVAGNLKATMSLLVVILVSAIAVYAVLLAPASASVGRVSHRYALAGTAYFFLIGLGFMMVEIGTIQRMSIFLGHPVYSLAIVLFSLILLTGIGSFLSDYIRLDHRPARLVGYALVLSALLASTALLAPTLLHSFEPADLLTRALVAIGLIAPAALLMGFGFPVGMALAGRIDSTPTPWFWSVNGAAGVFGSGVAVIISMNLSIPATLITGALCYLLLIPPALQLSRLAQTAAPTTDSV